MIDHDVRARCPSGSELFGRPGCVSTSATWVSPSKRTSLTGTRSMFRYVQHGAVLGAPDDAAERDVRLLLEQRADQVLERRRAREGVGIGVVVRQDDERSRAIENLQQVREHPATRGSSPSGGCRKYGVRLPHLSIPVGRWRPAEPLW